MFQNLYDPLCVYVCACASHMISLSVGKLQSCFCVADYTKGANVFIHEIVRVKVNICPDHGVCKRKPASWGGQTESGKHACLHYAKGWFQIGRLLVSFFLQIVKCLPLHIHLASFFYQFAVFASNIWIAEASFAFPSFCEQLCVPTFDTLLGKNHLQRLTFLFLIVAEAPHAFALRWP